MTELSKRGFHIERNILWTLCNINSALHAVTRLYSVILTEYIFPMTSQGLYSKSI